MRRIAQEAGRDADECHTLSKDVMFAELKSPSAVPDADSMARAVQADLGLSVHTFVFLSPRCRLFHKAR